MKKLSVLLFGLLASLNLTAYSEPGIPSDTIPVIDSTQILGAPVHVWNKIFQDLAAGDAAHALINSMQEELNTAERLQKRTEDALMQAQQMTVAAKGESQSWKDRYEIKDKQNEEARKEGRRYKRERNIAIILDVLLTIAVVIGAL